MVEDIDEKIALYEEKISTNKEKIRAYEAQIEQLQECVDALNKNIEDIDLQFLSMFLLKEYMDDEESWRGNEQKEFCMYDFFDYTREIIVLKEKINKKISQINYEIKRFIDKIDDMMLHNKIYDAVIDGIKMKKRLYNLFS